MRLFFISDIHGNKYALEAILKKAKEVNADKIYCLGDISGYFIDINEVINLLKEHNVLSIKGNHDAFLTNESEINKMKGYYSAYKRSKDTIGEEEKKWIIKLPIFSKIHEDNCNIEIYHGGNKNPLNEYTYPDKINVNQYEQNGADMFFFGHTHLQFVVKVGNITFANPGSVGLPRNGDFRAHGILYDTKGKKITKYKVPYDLNSLISRYINDDSINKVYLHNINFGRSSKKELVNRDNYFLNKDEIFDLESNGFLIINTKYGAVISKDEDGFLGDLVYIAEYADGTLSITSNTLIFNWSLGLQNCCFVNNNIIKDNAGLYYSKIYTNNREFKKKLSNIIIDVFTLINKIIL
ncbi:metallophosphatase family protein [Flavobacteriaceae bacterium]|nr:metallophosphatase family protein [Flavobacteriaceae bacterium]MDC0506613.1 metallophosphatase family protein [Flavobacteriaceae bacterium]